MLNYQRVHLRSLVESPGVKTSGDASVNLLDEKKTAEIGDGPSKHELFHILTWVCLKIDTPRIRRFIIISLLK
jgi:hypothetical protein